MSELDLYTDPHEIQFRGRRYRYDPDHDCFFAVPEALSTWDQYGWILVVAVLSLTAYLVTVL